MSQFLDYLGNPIAPGDIIVYPTLRGAGSSQLVMARVCVVDPIVPDPSGHGYCYESMKNKTDHARVRFPTWVDAKGKRHDDYARAYGLKVQKLWDGRLRFGKRSFENPDRMFTMRNVSNVAVVSSINKRDTAPLG